MSLHELQRLCRADLLPDATHPMITARRIEMHRHVQAVLRVAADRLERIG
jgi:hypothetical protein